MHLGNNAHNPLWSSTNVLILETRRSLSSEGTENTRQHLVKGGF